MNLPAKPTFVLRTLGCKVNQYESQAMRESLIKNGFIEEQNSEIADFYIINSCTVTSHADRDTRNLIHRFHKTNPDGRIVVAGCYAELDNDRKTLIEIPGVAYLARNSEKENIADILSTTGTLDNILSSVPERVKSHPSASLRAGESRVTAKITDFKDRNRAFIKIQDGCNHRCSYCKVSLVRGCSKSKSLEDILREARLLIEKGFKEIVLTGICLGAWSQGIDLAGLVEKISRIDGLFRIRLSSIEPIYVTDDIIHILKNNDKMCKHLHIPLQSGDDRILRAMQRPYTTKKFWQLVKKIRKQIPDAAITTDVLVGFPGEDDKRFRNTLKFIEHIKPSRMHVFSYSRREGTTAATFAYNLDRGRIRERIRALIDLGKKLSLDFAKKFIGKTQSTIIESYRDETTQLLAGYTDRYIRVFVAGPETLKNRLITLKITAVDDEEKRVLGQLDPSTSLGINTLA